MSEANLMRNIQLAISKTLTRLFRNNVGSAWMGTVISHSPHQVVIANPRRVSFGLCAGASDLIGWTPVVVTQEMVGSTVAVFTAQEVKMPGAKLRKDQAAFGNAVESAGGIFAAPHSVDEALSAVREWVAAHAGNQSPADPLGQAVSCPGIRPNNHGSQATRSMPRRGEGQVPSSLIRGPGI